VQNVRKQAKANQTISGKDRCSYHMGRERAKQDPLRARMSRSDRNFANGISRAKSTLVRHCMRFNVSSSPRGSAFLTYHFLDSKEWTPGAKAQQNVGRAGVARANCVPGLFALEESIERYVEEGRRE
jgi:hypothetical protein